MLSTAASIQASWTVPENQPDGSYLVTVDEAGVSHHEKVDGLPPVPASERRTINSAKFSLKPDILRRETYSTTCLGYCEHINNKMTFQNTDSTQILITAVPIPPAVDLKANAEAGV